MSDDDFCGHKFDTGGVPSPVSLRKEICPICLTARITWLEQRNKILEGSKTTQVMLDEVKKLFQEALDQRDEAEQKIYEFKRAVRRLMSGKTYG